MPVVSGGDGYADRLAVNCCRSIAWRFRQCKAKMMYP